MNIHLVTTVKTLTLAECVRLWHYANKFQKYTVTLHIGLENDPDQHHLTSLIYKLDWEKQHHNQNLDFNIYTAAEIYSLVKPFYEFRYVLIDQYLKDILKLEYIVYIDSQILFSQKATDSMWINIEQQTNWYGGNSMIYGKKLQADAPWIYLPEYPLLNNTDGLNNNAIVGIFNDHTVKSNFYSSWQSFIKSKYLDGSNLFQWEKTHEYRS